MTKRLFVLAHDLARQNAGRAVQEAPAGFTVTVAEPRKSRPQEEKYHAMFVDIAKQAPLHGKLREEETVKRLCVDQFWRDTKDDEELGPLWKEMRKDETEMLPSLDGSGVVSLGWQTRVFPKPLASAFLEWLYALGAELDVRWSEPHRRAA